MERGPTFNATLAAGNGRARLVSGAGDAVEECSLQKESANKNSSVSAAFQKRFEHAESFKISSVSSSSEQFLQHLPPRLCQRLSNRGKLERSMDRSVCVLSNKKNI